MTFKDLITKADAFFENGLLQFLISLAVILVAAFVLRRLLRRWSKKAEGHTFRPFMFGVLKVLIVFLVILFIMMQVTPLKNIAGSLLAGTSVLALALSLACQESVGNFIAGLFIIASKPFEVGDYIKVGEFQGTVDEITMRHTVLHTWENNRVIIPNSVVNSREVTNFNTGGKPYCSFLSVSVSHGSDLEKAVAVGRAVIETQTGVVDVRTASQRADGEPAVTARCSEITETGAKLTFSVWTADYGSTFDILSDVRRRLVIAYGENGIRFGHMRFGRAEE